MRSATGSASRALSSSSAGPSSPRRDDGAAEVAERRARLGGTDLGQTRDGIPDRPSRSHRRHQVIDEVGPRRHASAAAGIDPRAVTIVDGSSPADHTRHQRHGDHGHDRDRPPRPRAAPPAALTTTNTAGGTRSKPARASHAAHPFGRRPARDAPWRHGAATAAATRPAAVPRRASAREQVMRPPRPRDPELAQPRRRLHRLPAGVPPRNSNSRVASIVPATTSPVGATISTTRRCPLRCSSACTTMSMLDATVGSTNDESMFRPASSGSVASLARASRRCWRGSSTCPAARCSAR